MLNQGAALRQLLHVDGGVDTCSVSYKTGKVAAGVALAATGYGLVADAAATGTTLQTLYLTSKLVLGAAALEDLTTAEALQAAIESSSEEVIETSINAIKAASKIIPKGRIIW